MPRWVRLPTGKSIFSINYFTPMPPSMAFSVKKPFIICRTASLNQRSRRSPEPATTSSKDFPRSTTSRYHTISETRGCADSRHSGHGQAILSVPGKIKKTGGNLSLASQTIAPPGYSYHGIGDFDVGQVGFGVANFSTRFSRTKVYKKLTRLDYIVFRYPQDNRLGVLVEPWHIQIV